MKSSSAAWILLLCTSTEAFVALFPRSGTQHEFGGRRDCCNSCTPTSSRTSRQAISARRLTSVSTISASTASSGVARSSDRKGSITAMDAGNPQKEKLVLREFSVPLEASPLAYERCVRARCLREGGEAASVVRWHIRHADQQTGQAHVEAVFLVSSGGAEADADSVQGS
ncbi:unnamed protein product [Scytosiphon promiscuus]